MKRISLLLFFFVLTSTASVFAGHEDCNITVTSPNGGETYAEETVNITWSVIGGCFNNPNVSITYNYNGGASSQQVVAATSSTAGTYAWDTTGFPEATDATITVDPGPSGGFGFASADTSDATFTLSFIQYGQGGGGSGASATILSKDQADNSSEPEEIVNTPEEVLNNSEEVLREDEIVIIVEEEVEVEIVQEDEEVMDEEDNGGVVEDTQEEKSELVIEDETVIGFYKFLTGLGIVSEATDCEDADCEGLAVRKDVLEMSLLAGQHALIDAESFTNQFEDIDYSDQASSLAVNAETGIALGIISPDNTSFRGEDPITRAEAYAMIMTSVCIAMPTDSDDWMTNVYHAASDAGLTMRSQDDFEGESNLLRQDFFAITARVLQYTHLYGNCYPE